jgi:NDP-sugar pyrophosphorylase family protein
MMNVVIPMAGLGSRFKDAGVEIPKPLIEINNLTMIEHTVKSLNINANYFFITRRYDDELYNHQLEEIFNGLGVSFKEIRLDYNQRGAADAALAAEEYIDNEDPLIITNCDQILQWDSEKFLNAIDKDYIDGALVLYKSNDIKDSYAKVIDNKVIKVIEKNAISNDALVGVHYWKMGKDFVASAKLSLMDHSWDKKESYISETYNHLINEGKYIYPYRIPNNEYICLGTPDHVEGYLGKVKEFYTEKPKTIFCDIDGTIIKHVHRFSEVGKDPAEILPGVREKFDEWDSKGYKIILTTARKESARRLTEKQLSLIGLPWDYLLMGITSGQRVLINDKLINNDPDRAIAINVITSEGFVSEEFNNL